MKRYDFKGFFIVCALILGTFLAATVAAQAQTFARTNAVVATATSEVVIIAGERFSGGTSKTGSVYINRTSAKSGKDYRQYLGYMTSKRFEGAKVFRNKDASQFFIYEIGRTGFPKKVPLTVQ